MTITDISQPCPFSPNLTKLSQKCQPVTVSADWASILLGLYMRFASLHLYGIFLRLQTKDMYFRLIIDSKLAKDLNLSVYVCLFL